MLKEYFHFMIKWVVFTFVFSGSLYLSYQVGRVHERRIASPIIQKMQFREDCLTRANKFYRRLLNDSAGGWCEGEK